MYIVFIPYTEVLCTYMRVSPPCVCTLP